MPSFEKKNADSEQLAPSEASWLGSMHISFTLSISIKIEILTLLTGNQKLYNVNSP